MAKEEYREGSLMHTPEQNSAIGWFEHCGFRVVHAINENFFMVIPSNDDEHKRYGTAVFSPEAMQRIGEMLAGF